VRRLTPRQDPKGTTMPRDTSVVTPERFAEGLTYAEFLAQATVNADKFEHYHRTSPLTADDLAFFAEAVARPDGLAKIMAIAEAWCGDVYRELPTVARIAEASGAELRIFLREQNPDIMDEFLSNEGQSRAIPVVVFYRRDHRYLTHFTERAAVAHQDLADAQAAVTADLQLPAGTKLGTAPQDQRQAFIAALIARIEPRLPEWQRAAIQEMRSLLATALKTTEAAAGARVTA